jgi:hypothetical protein
MRRPSWFEPLDSAAEWIGFLGGIAVFSAVVAVLVSGRVDLSELSCWEPADSCSYSVYVVRNDLDASIVLRECLHQCGAGDRRLGVVSIEAGGVEKREVAAPVGVHVWWEVASARRRVLGCLVLDGHAHKHDDDSVRVSSLGACTTTASVTPFVTA